MTSETSRNGHASKRKDFLHRIKASLCKSKRNLKTGTSFCFTILSKNLNTEYLKISLWQLFPWWFVHTKFLFPIIPIGVSKNCGESDNHWRCSSWVLSNFVLSGIHKQKISLPYPPLNMIEYLLMAQDTDWQTSRFWKNRHSALFWYQTYYGPWGVLRKSFFQALAHGLLL